MNTKQKVVLGVMIVALSCVVLFMREGGGSFGPISFAKWIPWEKIIASSIPIILIGGYLIFVLKNHKGDGA